MRRIFTVTNLEENGV